MFRPDPGVGCGPGAVLPTLGNEFAPESIPPRGPPFKPRLGSGMFRPETGVGCDPGALSPRSTPGKGFGT